jgi:PAP2 superfamily C-terminal
VISAWKIALHNRRFVAWFLFALTTIVLIISFVEWYFQNIILNKPGFVIPDFVLDQFEPRDWSLEIMTLIYGALFIGIATNLGNPWRFLLGISTFAIVFWLRMIAMYLFTLEAPSGVIPLSDPFLTLIVYNKSDFVKDLFFSGHVSSMCVATAVEIHKKIKWLLAVMTVTMGVLILWQHVHYTIDVVAAVIITFSVTAILKKYFLKTPPLD